MFLCFDFLTWVPTLTLGSSTSVLIKVGQDETKSPEINESSDKRRKMHK